MIFWCVRRRGHKVVVFVLDDLDMFAAKAKQTVLYYLLDSMQIAETQVSSWRTLSELKGLEGYNVNLMYVVRYWLARRPLHKSQPCQIFFCPRWSPLKVRTVPF